MMKVVFVLPRYGANLGGGAEALSRSLLLAWASGRYELPKAEIEVWATCATDHRTWANELPAGESFEDGVKVKRFLVSDRNLDTFLNGEFSMRDGWPLSVEEQLDWLENSVNSFDLYEEIYNRQDEVDLFVFAPYLFGTSFWGPLIAPDKSVMIPCLHDEHYAYQQVFRSVFKNLKGVVFNTQAEKELAQALFSKLPTNKVVGMGFEEPKDYNPELLSKFGLEPKKYFLYAGRKEEGKNVGLLLEWYEEEAPLVFIGSGELPGKEHGDNVIDLGFVSEEEKRALLGEAAALVQLSENESFSIVLMEAWQLGTPVVVHGSCSVTKAHAIESGGGLFPKNKSEFSAVCRKLLNDQNTSAELGKNGAEYVKTEYSWPAVAGRLSEFLKDVREAG